MSQQFDFNDVGETEERFALIPDQTLAKVILHIEPGGHNDLEKGWTGGIVTCNAATGSAYLKCTFTIMGGKYDKRKVFGMIGLFSAKGERWVEMGRKFIKGILDSAHGYKSTDMSELAQNARKIENYHALNGLVFIAKISAAKDLKDQHRNEISQAIPPEYAAYNGLMFPDQALVNNMFNDNVKTSFKASTFDDEPSRVPLDDEIPF